MIAVMMFAGSIAVGAIAYRLHRKWNPERIPTIPDEFEVDVHPERHVGEILMFPFGGTLSLDNCYAVIVVRSIGNDYYEVQTFHEVPRTYTVHTTNLFTKSEIDDRSRLIT